MFILRQLSELGESNIDLGKSYTFTHEVHQPEEFKRLFEMLEDNGKNRKPDDPLCAYVHSENGEAYRIYTTHSTFTMTQSGKTFSRLS